MRGDYRFENFGSFGRFEGLMPVQEHEQIGRVTPDLPV